MTKTLRFWPLLLVGAVLTPATAWAQSPLAAHAPARNAADVKLRALYNGYSAWAAKEGG